MVTKVKNVYTFIQFMEFSKVVLICRVLNGLVQEFAIEVPTLKYTKNRRVEAAIERDIPVEHSELYISLWNDNIQSSKQKKNEVSIPVFDSDWTSVSCPLCKPLHGRYNFVGFTFRRRLSFLISKI